MDSTEPGFKNPIEGMSFKDRLEVYLNLAKKLL